MQFTLKDYQSDAVQDVLRNLQDAADDWQRKKRPVAFSLTATTGAGKTVMAAAVIEALFNGNDEFDFALDPSAVVLWFTDDPSLNEQTRFRLLEAAGDSIPHSALAVVGRSFNQEKLESGKVYFLNAQKLSKNSLLVKGAPDDAQSALVDRSASPDLRSFTMWDTIRNTIEDPTLTLYLILDEAHRGMKPPSTRDRAEKSTTVARLINGSNGVPPVPIVLGISATVDRFDQAMAAAEGRLKYPSVVVDPVRVQESGLLKDDIRLEFPSEVGQFDTVLLKRAVRTIKESTALWKQYATDETNSSEVVPLLVVQVPNTPSDELLLATFDAIRDEWSDLETGAMAHVFGEHSAIELAGHNVPYIRPEKVEESRHVRVLFAKDAISTGWDCPRAEVLVSFRPAQDETHITQLLGRMVRTPLARRIPGNDKLNSVECILPMFNRKAASSVALVLLGSRAEGDDGTGGSGGGEGRRVLVAPIDMIPNASIQPAIWDAFDRLPSQTVPRRTARPMRRLAALAQALSQDGLRPNARKEAYNEMFGVLDGLAVRHKTKVAAATKGILEVEGASIVAGVGTGLIAESDTFVELADDRSVEADFKEAGRVLTPDLARKYAEHIAVDDGVDDGLFDAHLRVAALSQIDGIQGELDREADELVKRWLTEARVAIKNLRDERRSVYDGIIAMSSDPQRIDVLRPRVRSEATRDGSGDAVDSRPFHLMSDDQGLFPLSSIDSSWETRVLDAELKQPGFAAWYRNPSRASEDSLAIAYRDGVGSWRRMCPDFVFFSDASGQIRPSIVDPHGSHFSDSLPKLRGLSDYAAEFGDEFLRIESVAEIEADKLRVLDLKDPKVREAVHAADDARALYLSSAAADY